MLAEIFAAREGAWAERCAPDAGRPVTRARPLCVLGVVGGVRLFSLGPTDHPCCRGIRRSAHAHITRRRRRAPLSGCLVEAEVLNVFHQVFMW